ncbi:hypothetical protein [Formosa sp. PL04]|uniref:hypothetical protein n=1 Tax=Formosa sp. PL04 TaxID=3081755 RepID=UPI0029827EA8|nr:hypothetical protein [Formosa sp. PL04]MDW5288887.1 hypothetical protein [Formosa sp. PL04]
MSKIELSKIIDSTVSELTKIKIGLLVRATLPEILELELISELEVVKLTQSDYSKMTLDLNYPVLRLVDEKKSIKENRIISEYTRYYAKPHNYKDSRYLISSEWYEKSQLDYIKWLKRKVQIS